MKKGIFFTLVTALMFVTLEPISKLIAGDVSPYAITFWRFLIGALMLLPPAIIKVKKEGLKITGKDIVLFALLGVLLICVSMLSLQIAVKIATAPSLIAIIFSSNSIFTIVFACLLLKEKPAGKPNISRFLAGLDQSLSGFRLSGIPAISERKETDL